MRRIWTAYFLVAGAVVFMAQADPVEASRLGEDHCVVEVVGVRADGAFVTEEPMCFSSYAGVAKRLGVDTRNSADARSGVAALSSTIGIHYDGFNFTGSSITVTGANCGGGYLNLTVAWRNRISSTINGCPQVRFYDFINLGGTAEATFASGNLTTHNNRADSVQYTT